MNRRLPALVATLLCACSTPPAGGPASAGSAGVALSDFCTATADASCRGRVRCGGVPESQLAACIRVESSTCELDRLVARVEAGRVDYDGVAYRRCLDRFAAAELCDDGRNPVYPAGDPDCVQAAVGRVEPGAPCGRGWGPLVGLECADGVCSSYGCDGRCRARAQLGDACTELPCAAGLHCVGGACRPLAVAGETCELYRFDCAPGLFCHTEGDEPQGTCAAPLAIGARCRDFRDVCVPGAYCPEEDSATCMAFAGEGAPCDEVPDTCVAGFRCSAGRCVAQEPPGGTCSNDHDCVYPATCGAETGVCVLRPVVGEPCEAAAGPAGACATGWCDGTTCRPSIPPGESCTRDSQCAGPETQCIDGRCVSWGCGG